MSSARLIDTAIGGNASSTGPFGPSIVVIAAGLAAWQHDHLVAGPHYAAGHGAGIAAVVGMLGGLRPDDVLHREPHVDEVAVAGDVDVLEMAQQRRTRRTTAPCPTWSPRCRRWSADIGMVVTSWTPAGRRRRGTRRGSRSNRSWSQSMRSILLTASTMCCTPQQRGQEGVPAGLLEQPVAGVDEHDHQLCGGCAGHHVAGVLDVARGVGDDEFPLGRGEVAVGDVDGDALLAFGAQPVGDQREVGVVVAALARVRSTAASWSSITALES